MANDQMTLTLKELEARMATLYGSYPRGGWVNFKILEA